MGKEEKIIKLLGGEVESITFHNVSAEWWRMNGDMYYTGDTPVNIVQFTYSAECYAMPAYILQADYNRLTASEIAEQVEV